MEVCLRRHSELFYPALCAPIAVAQITVETEAAMPHWENEKAC